MKACFVHAILCDFVFSRNKVDLSPTPILMFLAINGYFNILLKQYFITTHNGSSTAVNFSRADTLAYLHTSSKCQGIKPTETTEYMIEITFYTEITLYTAPIEECLYYCNINF